MPLDESIRQSDLRRTAGNHWHESVVVPDRMGAKSQTQNEFVMPEVRVIVFSCS